MKAKHFFLLLVVIMLAGCEFNPTLSVKPTATPSLSPSPTSPATIAASNTPTILPEARLKIQCLDILPFLQPGLEASGILVLDSETSPSTYLKDMTSGITTEMFSARSFLVDATISPDRKWIAYERISPYQGTLIIANAKGQTEKIIDLEDLKLIGWLNNEQLVLRMPAYIPTSTANPVVGNENKFVYPTLLILNPFTGEQRTLEPNFPDLRSPEWLPNWGDWNGLVYDPSLTHAVYPSNRGLTLRDLDNGRTTSFPDFDWTEAFPQWSPDGSRFAFANNVIGAKMSSEIFTIDLDGQVRQLSNLNAYYAGGYISPAFSWSPDGSYIAFWLKVETLDFSLSVLDTATGEVVNYCVGGPFNIAVDTLPLWAPDGTQIVLENYVPGGTSRVVLVDIVHGVAAQIGEGLKPVGWLVETP